MQCVVVLAIVTCTALSTNTVHCQEGATGGQPTVPLKPKEEVTSRHAQSGSSLPPESVNQEDKYTAKVTFESNDETTIIYNKHWNDENTFYVPLAISNLTTDDIPSEWQSVDFKNTSIRMYLEKMVRQRGRVEFQIPMTEMQKLQNKSFTRRHSAEGTSDSPPVVEVPVVIPQNVTQMIEFNQSVSITRMFYVGPNNVPKYGPIYELSNLQDSFWIEDGQVYHKWLNSDKNLTRAELIRKLSSDTSLFWTNFQINELEPTTESNASGESSTTNAGEKVFVDWLSSMSNLPNVEVYEKGVFAVLTPEDFVEYQRMNDSTTTAPQNYQDSSTNAPGSVSTTLPEVTSTESTASIPEKRPDVTFLEHSSIPVNMTDPRQAAKDNMDKWKSANGTGTQSYFDDFDESTVKYCKQWDDSNTFVESLAVEELTTDDIPSQWSNIDFQNTSIHIYLEKTVRQRGRVEFRIMMKDMENLVNGNYTNVTTSEGEDQVVAEIPVYVPMKEAKQMIEFNQSVTFTRMFYTDEANTTTYSPTYELSNFQDSFWVENGKVIHKWLGIEKNITEYELAHELLTNPTLQWTDITVKTNETSNVVRANLSEQEELFKRFVEANALPNVEVYEKGVYALLTPFDVNEYNLLNHVTTIRPMNLTNRPDWSPIMEFGLSNGSAMDGTTMRMVQASSAAMEQTTTAQGPLSVYEARTSGETIGTPQSTEAAPLTSTTSLPVRYETSAATAELTVDTSTEFRNSFSAVSPETTASPVIVQTTTSSPLSSAPFELLETVKSTTALANTFSEMSTTLSTTEAQRISNQAELSSTVWPFEQVTSTQATSAHIIETSSFFETRSSETTANVWATEHSTTQSTTEKIADFSPIKETIGSVTTVKTPEDTAVVESKTEQRTGSSSMAMTMSSEPPTTEIATAFAQTEPTTLSLPPSFAPAAESSATTPSAGDKAMIAFTSQPDFVFSSTARGPEILLKENTSVPPKDENLGKKRVEDWKNSNGTGTQTSFNNFDENTIKYYKHWDDSNFFAESLAVEELTTDDIPAEWAGVDFQNTSFNLYLEKTVRQRGRVEFMILLKDMENFVNGNFTLLKNSSELEEGEENPAVAEVPVYIPQNNVKQMIEFNQSVTFTRMYYTDSANNSVYAPTYELSNLQDSFWIENGKVLHKWLNDEKNVTEAALAHELLTNPTLQWTDITIKTDEAHQDSNEKDSISRKDDFAERFAAASALPNVETYDKGVFALLTPLEMNEFNLLNHVSTTAPLHLTNSPNWSPIMEYGMQPKAAPVENWEFEEPENSSKEESERRSQLEVEKELMEELEIEDGKYNSFFDDEGKTHFVPQGEYDYDNETDASAFAARFNYDMRLVAQDVANAKWNYELDATKENKRNYEDEIDGEAVFRILTHETVKNFQTDKFVSQVLRRQFVKLSNIGPHALGLKKFKVFRGLIKKMKAIQEEQVTGSSEKNGKFWRFFAAYVKLANKAAETNNFPDYGALRREPFECDDPDYVRQLKSNWNELRPFYNKLHAYLRLRLRQNYGDKISPSGMIPDTFATEGKIGPNLVRLLVPYPEVEQFKLKDSIEAMSPDILAKYIDNFFISIGLEAMKADFWEKSIFQKTSDKEFLCHFDGEDVFNGLNSRIKVCAQNATLETLELINHEMSHVAYAMMLRYLPKIFKESAVPAFDEAFGEAIGLSAISPNQLASLGFARNYNLSDERSLINYQMKLAFEKVFPLPFYIFVDLWRWNVFSGQISEAAYSEQWFKFQEYFTGFSRQSTGNLYGHEKAHLPLISFIASDEATDRLFVGGLLQFAFHEAMCNRTLFRAADLHLCNIYGSFNVGPKVREVFSQGSSTPWTRQLARLTGDKKISTQPLLKYFKPLIRWLDSRLEGKNLGW